LEVYDAGQDYSITGQNQTMSSDIDTERFIFRKTPALWHPYIKLARLDRPIGVWLLLFPCWWAIVLSSGGILTLSPQGGAALALVVPGALFMRAAGCIVNDLWDRKLDASVDRTKTRPLVSGEISVRQAVIFLTLLLLLSLFILLLLPPLAIILGVLSLLLVSAYPKMKRITWWPQLFLGFTFNWGALLGWAAVTNRLAWGSLLLYIGGIFWTLGYDTIYAHQDKEDDALVGIKSTARLFAEKSRIYVATFYGLSLFFLMMAKYAAAPGILTPLLALPPLLQIIWQMKTWEMDDPQSCLRTFRSNQLYGWLVLLMLAA
jgi:4-hydroxybenzoate polyprenyltransferase